MSIRLNFKSHSIRLSITQNQDYFNMSDVREAFGDHQGIIKTHLKFKTPYFINNEEQISLDHLLMISKEAKRSPIATEFYLWALDKVEGIVKRVELPTNDHNKSIDMKVVGLSLTLCSVSKALSLSKEEIINRLVKDGLIVTYKSVGHEQILRWTGFAVSKGLTAPYIKSTRANGKSFDNITFNESIIEYFKNINARDDINRIINVKNKELSELMQLKKELDELF